MMLFLAEDQPLLLEEITLTQDQQEEVPVHHVVLLQLEKRLPLEGQTAKLEEIRNRDAVLVQPEEVIVPQNLGVIILLQEDPLLPVEIIQEALDHPEVHLPPKEEVIKNNS